MKIYENKKYKIYMETKIYEKYINIYKMYIKKTQEKLGSLGSPVDMVLRTYRYDESTRCVTESFQLV